MSSVNPNVICIASYEKGHAFLSQLASEGCNITFLTTHKLRDAAWPWEAIRDIHTFSDVPEPAEVLQLVQRIARHLHVDRIVALDEFDLEAAALIREEMRLPGMGQSTTRHFRDKLAMRVRARNAGVLVPDFIGIHTHEDVSLFLHSTQGPWLLKPRFSAAAIGIRTIQHPDDLWRALDELGDRQHGFLLECFVPGNVFHVDSVSWGGKTLLQSAQGYGTAPMSLMHSGGVFTTRTLDRSTEESHALRAIDTEVLRALGMISGVTHSEFIKADHDGRLYFLESAARVGGAYIADLVEASTGINPWREWARIEAALAHGRDFALSPVHEAYAGSVICLARQESPDLSAYTDPEIVLRMPKHHHAGLLVQSQDAHRVEQLLGEYRQRFAEDFCATLPPPDRPTS
ncbi:MAG: ATPase [Terriglobus sp.]